MAARGWIKIYRQIQEHYLWGDKPFARGQAWVDLLLMASHAENKFLLGGSLVTSKAGDVVTSELKLMERWGWSKSKVRKFLELLEADGMIVKRSDRKKTTISIANWGKFQNRETTEELVENLSTTTGKPSTDTIKKVKNDNKMTKNGERDTRRAYGTYQNVFLTDDEYETLLSEYPDLGERVEYLSEYMRMHGKHYEDHCAVIRGWAKEGGTSGISKKGVKTQGTRQFLNYTPSGTDWNLVADAIIEKEQSEIAFE